MATPPPVPMRSPVVDRGFLHREFVRFLSTLVEWLSRTTQELGAASEVDQAAAIATTDIVLARATQNGLYRVSYSLRISQAATTSSSAALTLGWTTNSVSCSQAFSAITGNTTATQTSDAITVLVDANSAITYSVSYTSVGATPMQFGVDVRVEELP